MEESERMYAFGSFMWANGLGFIVAYFVLGIYILYFGTGEDPPHWLGGFGYVSAMFGYIVFKMAEIKNNIERVEYFTLNP